MSESNRKDSEATLLSEEEAAKENSKSNSVIVASHLSLQKLLPSKHKDDKSNNSSSDTSAGTSSNKGNIQYSLFIDDSNVETIEPDRDKAISESKTSLKNISIIESSKDKEKNNKNEDKEKDDKAKDNSNEDSDKENDDDNIESLSYSYEIFRLSKMSIPISIGNFARLAMYNIDSIFLGHLGTDQLAGVALCMILMEIVTNFVYAPSWSLNGLCSQAIGANNSPLAGNWFILSIALSTVISLPALVVYWYIADIIAIFESNDEVIHYARIFSHFAGSWLLLGSVNMALRGYLQSIEVILPLTVVPIITIITDALLNYVLIYGIHLNLFNGIIVIDWNGLGFIGSPLATLSSVVLQLLLFYVWCFAYKKHHINKNAWPKQWSFKKDLLNMDRIRAFNKIMIPNMISDATENWAYQVTVIMCATLPSSNVAALSCMFDFWGVLWSFYSGFGQCTITRIGKEIGKGNIQKAQFYTKVSVITGSMVTLILSTLVMVFSNDIGRLYSNDSEVIGIMDDSLQILAIVYLIGSVGWTASNTMESMSKNKERGVVLVVTAWLVYLPIALYLAFDSKNVVNEWFGIDCPVCMIFWTCLVVELLRTIILWMILVYKVDWKRQSMCAMIRSEIGSEVIAEKLNLELEFVENEMKKQRKSKENKESNNDNNDTKLNEDSEQSNMKSKEDDNSNIEYVSLHNTESFSTSVEIETIDSKKDDKLESKSMSNSNSLSLLNNDELKLMNGVKNSDLLKTNNASQLQVA